MMKLAAMVPIKMNNQRTPGKNTKKFDDGRALLTVHLQTLAEVQGINKIYVFCSDPAIQKYLIPGAEYLERPRYLDTQEATPQNIISEFMKLVKAEIYLVSHCTSPFVTVEHFEECIKAVTCGAFDSAFTGEKIQRLLWSSRKEPFNFKADAIPRTQDLEPIYSEVSAAYVFKREVFEQTHRRVGECPHIVEVKGVECVDIDYPEDFEIANAIYMNIIKKKGKTG